MLDETAVCLGRLDKWPTTSSDCCRDTRKARGEFEARVDEVEIARDEYYQMVSRLHRAGMPLRDIAEELGLSHQRVHQMIGESEGRKRPSKAASRTAKAGGAALLAVALLATGWTIARTQDSELPDAPSSTAAEEGPAAPERDERSQTGYIAPPAGDTMPFEIYCLRQRDVARGLIQRVVKKASGDYVNLTACPPRETFR